MKDGFYHATVDSIAERAEVSKGTVYLYFESKETILACLLLEGLEALVDYLGQAYASERSLIASERLRRLGEAYFQFFQRQPLYFRFLMAVDGGRFREAISPEVYQRVLEASLEGLNLAVRAIEQGVREGAFQCCDPRLAAAAYWGTLNGVLDLMSHPLRQDMIGVSVDVLYRTAMDTVIRGLRGQPAASSDDTTR